MSKETGGPAFPRDHAADGHNGMDLRDYFAAKAMQATIPLVVDGDNVSDSMVAKIAFKIADAMIAERNKP